MEKSVVRQHSSSLYSKQTKKKKKESVDLHAGQNELTRRCVWPTSKLSSPKSTHTHTRFFLCVCVCASLFQIQFYFQHWNKFLLFFFFIKKKKSTHAIRVVTISFSTPPTNTKQFLNEEETKQNGSDEIKRGAQEELVIIRRFFVAYIFLHQTFCPAWKIYKYYHKVYLIGTPRSNWDSLRL